MPKGIRLFLRGPLTGAIWSVVLVGLEEGGSVCLQLSRFSAGRV